MKIYLAYFAKFLKARLSYKFDFFAGIIANAISTGSSLIFILLLLDGTRVTNLQGWTQPEVLFIYGYSMIPLAIFGLLAPNLYQFGDKYIIQGQFDRVLLRPLSTLPQVLFESFNLDALGSLTVGIITTSIAASRLNLEFAFLDIVWFAISTIAAAIILLSFFVSLASIAFHFEDRLGLAAPMYNLIVFGRYPITIFSKLIQFILQWVVPFAFVAFYPATHFFTERGFGFYTYLSPVVALATATLTYFVWNFGVSRYASTGN
ncbi:ABC-2 family transporter protein [bacterium]|nr:ABC-2 family transporter protein [bacterium]